ncbi:hypothetical protein [Altererythrobacter sp.]|uniref:hypothetical protein n=1 Tax=Altererythrobacter sp. TaxID=1872480 RepID=UPI003D0506CA
MQVRSFARLLPIPAISLALAACNPPADSGGVAAEQSATPEPSGTATSSAKPVTMAETGWLVVGRDGSILTTYLDADDTYRDLRNGQPLQTGQWTRSNDGELCFTPDAEDRAGDCWTLGKPGDDGTLRATDTAGLEIELRQIPYQAPETKEQEAR